MISSIGIGGEANVLRILTENFVKMNQDVSVFILSSEKRKEVIFHDKVIIYRSKSNGNKIGKNLCRIRELKSLYNEVKYDIVIGFASRASVMSCIAFHNIIPVIVTERNDPHQSLLLIKTMRSVAYRWASGAVFQTKQQYDIFPYIKHRKIISNPLSAARFPYNLCKEKERCIINTARLVPQKNQKMLICAFSELANQFPEYTLQIYGDGLLENELKKLVNDLGMKGRIFILPSRNDILDIVNTKMIFVLSSNYEGFSNSLAEAMALGLACISTNCPIGGSAEMIKNKENGILIDVGDHHQLVNAMRELMADDEEVKRLGTAAMAIKNKLNEEKIAQSWLLFIEEIIKQ